VLITKPDDIRYTLDKLTYSAKTGRQGPVLLDIPMNIQRAEITPGCLVAFDTHKTEHEIQKPIMDSVLDMINNAVRPVVLVGGGVRSAQAVDQLRAFVTKNGIPVVTTLMGIDAIPGDAAEFSGMLGTYGNRYANLAVANADLILALGTRFDTRQTGTKPDTFAREAKIIHVDIDPHELNNKVKAHLAIHSDVKAFLNDLNTALKTFDKQKIAFWKKTVSGYKERYPSYKSANDPEIEPNYFIHLLSKYLPEDAIVCVLHRVVWARWAQHCLWQSALHSLNRGKPL
jgi:acetolactate synthase-1/2/3 large subunit